MNLSLLDLRAIKFFDFEGKQNLVISIALQPDGTPLVVSRYGDDIWDFYPYISQLNVPLCEKQIDWRITLPDGRLLTDPEHVELLEMAKDFIWSLFSEPVEGRKRPTMLTLKMKTHNLTPLLRWMVKIGLCRFADLAGRTFEYVPVAKIKYNGESMVGDYTVCARLTILEDLYHQRNKLRNALPDHPWPHESAFSLSGRKDGREQKKQTTEAIPDAIAVRLAVAAIDYVQNQSTRILDTLEVLATVSKEKTSVGYAKPTVIAMLTATARRAGFASQRELTTEMIHLRTACYIVIDLFSGIRDSEMMSIAENCITRGKSKDGSTDVLWLHGMIYKTGLRPKKWMVPPIVEEVIDKLTRLTVPLRMRLQQEERELETRIGLSITTEQKHLVKRLNTVRRQKDKLFLSQSLDGVVSVHSGSSMRHDLRRFCSARQDFSRKLKWDPSDFSSEK